LLATAEVLGAVDAQRQGLVDAVAPEGIAASTFVKSYVAQMAQRPQVMRAFKSLAIMYRFGGSAEERAVREGALFAKAWVHDDHWAAVAKMAGSKK
jgi:enoyl-CoA hydratase/carnithine racemase